MSTLAVSFEELGKRAWVDQHKSTTTKGNAVWKLLHGKQLREIFMSNHIKLVRL